MTVSSLVISHADLQAAHGVALEYGEEFETLNGVLSTYCRCFSSKTGDGKMVAQFRLRDKEKMTNDADKSFDMLFMEHPHQDQNHPSGSDLFWQDTRIFTRPYVPVSYRQLRKKKRAESH